MLIIIQDYSTVQSIYFTTVVRSLIKAQFDGSPRISGLNMYIQ